MPYVTATAPLALTHASRTWSAVALSRRAISLTGLSTGPPGWRVIGLFYFVTEIKTSEYELEIRAPRRMSTYVNDEYASETMPWAAVYARSGAWRP